MSGTTLDNSRRLGPSEAPSIQDTGLDLENASLDPIEDRVSAGVRHQGDSAWKADQIAPEAPREQRLELTTKSTMGGARETTTVSSDFQSINEVGEQEYRRTLASMISDGASLEESYKAADLMRSRVTSVGGTDIASSREALQAEQAAKPLDEVEPQANAEGDRQGLQDQAAVGGLEGLENGLGESERSGLSEGVAEDVAQDETVSRGSPLAYAEEDLLKAEDSLGNENVLDLEVARQFEVVKGLKEGRVRELTGVAQDTVAVETDLDRELLAAVEEQFNQVRDAMNARVSQLSALARLTTRESEQLALGAAEEDALTF